MTTRTITLSTDDLAALRAIRPVIADAHAHAGRAAAIAALDRIADQVAKTRIRVPACRLASPARTCAR